MVAEINDNDFEEKVIKQKGFVLVDFWAAWCGPCKQIAPAIKDISENYADKLAVYKMNIEDSPETPTKYEVRGIPNLILFKDGEVFDSKVGALPKPALEAWIKEKTS
jgi:thioredoxin 1